MYSNKPKRRSRSVVSRLTLWYGLICTLVSIAAYTLLSIKLDQNINRRVEHDLENEIIELKSIYAEKGLNGLQEEFDRESKADGLKKVFFRLLSPSCTILASSDVSGWDGIQKELSAVPVPAANETVFFTLYDRNSPYNAQMVASRTFDKNIVQFGVNLKSNNIFRRKFRNIFIAFSISMFTLSTLSGWLIARRAMSGVRRVTQAVSRIYKGRLKQQVSLSNEGREIDELTKAFNEMLTRIDSLIRELKEVSDNVAHDLRSPITRMRGVAETTLTGPQEIEAYREMGLIMIEESERLTHMINTTLEIAQAESGLLEIIRTPFDLTALLKNAAELFQPAAEEKQIELCANLVDDPLIIYGDKTRIQRTVANLLDNAIKYTPPEGKITLTASPHGKLIKIKISDTGVGIAPEEIGRIFERFYRSEKSRSTQGNGLGLSLARTIIQAHGGNITVQSKPNEGSTFTITLPRDLES